MSQIHVMVISEMNCCFESGIHEYSPCGHIHVQILQRIAWWSFVDLPDSVVGGVCGDVAKKCSIVASILFLTFLKR